MKTTVSKLTIRSLAALSLALAGSASFAATTWAVDSCNSSTLSTGCGSTANKVTATAYAVRNDAPLTRQFSAATLLQHGANFGLGVSYGAESSAEPEHTMDNNLRTELIAFHFDQAIILDSVTMGYSSGDMDFTLMAYTGTGTPVIAGKTLATLAAGWSLVQNYGDAAPDTSYSPSLDDVTTTVNAGNVSSSWWIVSAYNSGYGAGAKDTLADYMKIMALSSRDPSVTPPNNDTPEPGSLALMGIAMAGFVATRRRKQQAA